MKVKALITSLTAVISLSGCNLDKQTHDLTPMELIVKNAISQGLDSPDSATWGEFSSDNSSGVVCGSVSASGSEAGQAGFKHFAFMRQQNTIFWEESEKFGKLVTEMCTNLKTQDDTIAATDSSAFVR